MKLNIFSLYTQRNIYQVNFSCCTINVVLRDTLVLEPQNVGQYSLGGGRRGSEKVYCLYTLENVDIFEWPLSYVTIFDG